MGIIRFIKQLYLGQKLFMVLSLPIVLFVLGALWDVFFVVGQISLLLIVALTVFDGLLLFGKNAKLKVQRNLKSQFSLGDKNKITLVFQSNFHFSLYVKVIDEIPYQFQKRDFELKFKLPKKSVKEESYYLTPNKRGAYLFQSVNVYTQTILGLLKRGVEYPINFETKVYPSVVQMRKYELQVFAANYNLSGVKKVRRLGNNQEFEQIRNYVRGDDFRKINWKATSRRGELMVNQYQDERSQSIYTIIDKSRSMKMPFNGMTLLDHSINTSLVISNIALRKHDKVGLLTFSDKLGVHLKSEKQGGQLAKIMEHLYRQKTHYKEANFEALFYGIKQQIKGRSLLFLYTNFETLYAMERAMPLLRKINKQHLLCVIFFENSELVNLSNSNAQNLEEIYLNTFAKKMVYEKRTIAKELEKYGINTILTTPEKLSVDTINKYLELKSRGQI